jgi:hypothetical protein
MIISVGKYAQRYGVYGIGLCLGMKTKFIWPIKCWNGSFKNCFEKLTSTRLQQGITTCKPCLLVCVDIPMYLCMYVCIYICICLPIYFHICLHTYYALAYLFMYYPFIHLLTYFSIYLISYVFLFLFLCHTFFVLHVLKVST